MTAGLLLVSRTLAGFDLPDLSLMVRMRFGSSTISEKISLNGKSRCLATWSTFVLKELFDQEAEKMSVYPLRDASARRGGICCASL